MTINQALTVGQEYKFHYPHTCPGFFGSKNNTEYKLGTVKNIKDERIVIETSVGYEKEIGIDNPKINDNELIRVEELDRTDSGAIIHESQKIVWEGGFLF